MHRQEEYWRLQKEKIMVSKSFREFFQDVFFFSDTTVWSLKGIYSVSVLHDKSKCNDTASVLVDGILSGGRGRSASTFWIIFYLKMMRC